VVVRLGKGPGPLGRQASPDPGRQGLRPLTGRVPVDGHLGRSHRRRGIGQLRPLGQRAGIGGMQPRPFAGHQVGLDDLTQQGVAQLVAVLARPGHQQLIGDRRAERLHQGLVLQAGDLGQEPVGDPSASHRHHPKHLPCQLGQRLDPAAEQIRNVGGSSPEPALMDPSSSSVKYGLPSERPKTASTSSAGGAAPTIPTS
jgi:hypothetical protein